MPYNINLIVYIITLTITYGLFLFINKKININRVCFMYLIIIIINSIFNTFTYQNILESTYNYSFSYVDYLMGRNIGGISSTSILFCLLTFSYLTYSIYYKKDIPLGINITYLILIFIYYFITKNNLYLINSELLFGSIFVSTIPMYSPYSKSKQIIYSIFIGIISFVITITFNSVISIYVATLIASLLMNIPLKKLTKR